MLALKNINVVLIFFSKGFSSYEEQLAKDVIEYSLTPSQQKSFRIHYLIEFLSAIRQEYRTSNVVMVLDDFSDQKIISYFGFGVLKNSNSPGVDYHPAHGYIPSETFYLDELVLTAIPNDTSVKLEKIEKLVQKHELVLQKKKLEKNKHLLV